MAKIHKYSNNLYDPMYNVGVDYNFNRGRQTIKQIQAGIDNLRSSTIDASILNAGTKSDLAVEQTGLQYERDMKRCGLSTTTSLSNVSRQSIDYSSMDWGDTFKQGGLSGVLDKLFGSCTNMTSGQKNTWKTLGVFGCVAGGIFGLYKFYTSEKMGFWGKAGITAATIFGSQALTGKGPISLFSEWMTGGVSRKKMTNRFGDVVAGLDSSGHQSVETVVPATQSLMLFDGKTTVGNLNGLTQSFRNNKQNRTAFYNKSCNKIQRKYGVVAMERFQAKFSSNFDENKREAWLASFGVTSSTNQTEKVHELANNAIMNQTMLEKFLSDNNLKLTDDAVKKSEFYTYIRNKNENNQPVIISDLQSNINNRFISVEQQPVQNPQSTEQQSVQNSGSTEQQSAQIPQATVEQSNPNIDITNELLKPCVEKGLSSAFTHLKSKYGFIVSKVGIKESSIPTYSQGITRDIILKICKQNGKTVTLDLSDNNIKYVYDNFINKLADTHSGFIKRTIKNYDRDGLSSKLHKRNSEGKMDNYNNRKGNFLYIFQSLFGEIVPALKSQGGEVKFASNGKDFTNLNDTINSLQIFS